MRQNLVNHFLNGKCCVLAAVKRRSGDASVFSFFASSGPHLRGRPPHGDSKAIPRKWSNANAQQEERANPEQSGTVQPCNPLIRNIRKELRPVAVARHSGPPTSSSRQAGKARLLNGGFPCHEAILLRASPLDIVDGCQDQADQRNWRPDSPLDPMSSAHGYQKSSKAAACAKTLARYNPEADQSAAPLSHNEEKVSSTHRKPKTENSPA